ncbi:MAG: flavoprotein [Candidatus Riflebacteria bacterium]
MSIISNNLPQTLKPLLLFCRPEDSSVAQKALEFDLPSVYEKADVAVSNSARQYGWLRPLAMKYRVFGAGDFENLALKLDIYDILLVNPLSLNTLAKLALGIRDSFPSELLFRFAELGKPILLSEAMLPTGDSDLNPHLIKVYKRYWDSVIGGTVSSFNEDNLAEKTVKIIRARFALSKTAAPVSQGRVFITRDDIIAACESLEPLKVPYGSVITDIAREEALARGVSIVFE